MPRSQSLPPLTQLNELLGYDPETGVFRWLVRRNHKTPVGSVAGSLDSKGYRRIKVNGFPFKAHRLAWYLVNHQDPGDLQVDHANGDKDDNRISNLRLATNAQNVSNTGLKANNKSGYKGVHWHKAANAWVAAINRKHLGCFEHPEQAALAYVRAAEALHGEFARLA
jgi:hypothetical protein